MRRRHADTSRQRRPCSGSRPKLQVCLAAPAVGLKPSLAPASPVCRATRGLAGSSDSGGSSGGGGSSGSGGDACSGWRQRRRCMPWLGSSSAAGSHAREQARHLPALQHCTATPAGPQTPAQVQNPTCAALSLVLATMCQGAAVCHQAFMFSSSTSTAGVAGAWVTSCARRRVSESQPASNCSSRDCVGHVAV